jgi:hypothetical protein
LKSKKPTIFLTLSAADTYWPELFDKLGIRDHQKLTYQDRNRILSQNPKLATQMFKKRFESLLDILLDSKLSPIGKVEDYWFRIEFQHRGSPHVHGLLWLEEDSFTDVSKIDATVQCFTPESEPSPNEYHPSSTTAPSITNIEACIKDLKSLCSNFQSHKCNSKCRKKKKKCKFPMELASQTKVELNSIIHRRNDPQLNNYQYQILRLWRANMDIQILKDPILAALYTSYYSSKTEPLKKAEEVKLLQKISKKVKSDDCSRQSKMHSILHNISGSRSVSIQEAFQSKTRF